MVSGTPQRHARVVGMQKPWRRLTALQIRSAIVVVVALGVAIWNVATGGPMWLTAIFGMSSVLAVGSVVLNRPDDQS